MKYLQFMLVFAMALGGVATPASAAEKADDSALTPPMSDRERIAADRAKANAEMKTQSTARPWDRDANGKRPWDTEQTPAMKK